MALADVGFRGPSLTAMGMGTSAMIFQVNVANKQNTLKLILDVIYGPESNSGAIFEVSESLSMFHNVSQRTPKMSQDV